MEDNVYTKSTKYFGNVEVKFDNYPNVGNGHASILAVLRHQDIYVSNIFVSIFNYNSMGDKLALCWDIIDKYLEINTIAINWYILKYSAMPSLPSPEKSSLKTGGENGKTRWLQKITPNGGI